MEKPRACFLKLVGVYRGQLLPAPTRGEAEGPFPTRSLGFGGASGRLPSALAAGEG